MNGIERKSPRMGALGLALLVGLLALALPEAAWAEVSLGRRIEALAGAFKSKTRGAVVGISVIDARTGKAVARVGADRQMIPASNQKLLTSATALCRLGAGYEFTTTVFLRGDDLVVVGDFDPTLGDPELARKAKTDIYVELDRWAKAVKTKVGTMIRGDLLLRSPLVGEGYRPADWPKNQHHHRYAAPVAQLSFHNNCYGVTFKVGATTVRPTVQPASYLIKIIDRTRKSNKHAWSLLSRNGGAVLEVRGKIKSSTSKPLLTAADNPPMLLGRVLADRLRRAGVTLDGQVKVVGPQAVDGSRGRLIAVTKTPLPRAMTRANKRSLNMAAECIFLRAGDGTWAGSAKLMQSTLTGRFGLAGDSIVVKDGSGLSRTNRVAPAAMTKVLLGMARRKDGKVLLESLPIAGIEGTLAKRMTGGAYRGRIRAKTGYISGVSCLSGYVMTADDKVAYAFSSMVNGVKSARGAKKLQDDICRLLVDSLD